jgi:hypothetical protein
VEEESQVFQVNDVIDKVDDGAVGRIDVLALLCPTPRDQSSDLGDLDFAFFEEVRRTKSASER